MKKMENEPLKIDLGCGSYKKEGFKGLDILPLPGVDFVANIEEGLGFLEDNSVDEYYTSHFLEHIENLELALSEIYRTLKPGGICTVLVPHFSNPHYYSDYTHKRFFGFYSFDYFASADPNYKRRVPRYNTEIRFRILDRKLVFKSPEYFIVNLLKKHLHTRFFNSAHFLQEVYEAFFTKAFSCYEIKFVLQAEK